MEVNKEKIRYVLQYCFDKGQNASQAAEVVNDVYGPGTVSANYTQFWFRRFRSGIFDVKDAPRTGRPVVENVNKIIEMIEVDQRVSSRSIAQELKMDHKTVLNHIHKAGFKKEHDVWVPDVELKRKTWTEPNRNITPIKHETEEEAIQKEQF